MKWLDGITNSVDMSLSKLQETVDEAQAGIKIAGRNINNIWHPGQMTSMAFPKEERVGGQFPSGEGRVGGAYAPLPAWAPPGKCPVWATTNPTPVLITACSPMVTCRPAALPKEQATGQVQSWTRYSKYRPRPSPGFTLSSVADMTNLSSSVFCWAQNWTSESFSTQCSR